MSQYPTSQNYGGPPPGMYQVAPANSVSANNPMGRAALALGVATVVLQILGQVVFYVLLGDSFSAIGVANGWFGLGSTALAIVAMVLGIIGLRKPGAKKGSAGIGFGIGAHIVVMTLVGFAGSLLYSL